MIYFFILWFYLQVKKYWLDEGYSNQNVHSLRKCERRISNPHHIGSDLQSQHVGQILCAQPHSLFGEKGNFGIVVQGTKVSFQNLWKKRDGHWD